MLKTIDLLKMTNSNQKLSILFFLFKFIIKDEFKKLFNIDNIVKKNHLVRCSVFGDVFVTSADGFQASVGNVNIEWILVHSIVSACGINFWSRCLFSKNIFRATAECKAVGIPDFLA